MVVRGGQTAKSTRWLVWHDEFSGAAGAPPSTRRWTAVTGGKGWGNGELQCYTDSARNAATDGEGNLIITARKETTSCPGSVNPFSSARLTTDGRFAKAYGKLEIRAKMPSGIGTWPAFWALGDDIGEAGWPRSGELDVVEYLPRSPRTTSGTLHGPTVNGQHWYIHREHRGSVALSETFHVYAAEWTPSTVTFLLDGKPFGAVTKADAAAQGTWVADKPYFLLLNLAVGGTLGGEVPASTTWPQHYAIDYVRVYR